MWHQRTALLAALKDVPCADCGNRYPACVMQFDHVRGEKVGDVASMKWVAVERIRAEAAKCDVVCANCHSIRTHERRGAGEPSRVPESRQLGLPDPQTCALTEGG